MRRPVALALGFLTLLAVCRLVRMRQLSISDAPAPDAAHVPVGARSLDDGRRGSSGPPDSTPGLRPVNDTGDWARFRFEHPALALTIAVTLDRTLETAASRCSLAGEDPDVEISATVTVQRRHVLLEDISCRPGARLEDRAAAEYCDCVIGRSRREAHVVLPNDTAQGDLVYYRGPLVLQHWTRQQS